MTGADDGWRLRPVTVGDITQRMGNIKSGQRCFWFYAPKIAQQLFTSGDSLASS